MSDHNNLFLLQQRYPIFNFPIFSQVEKKEFPIRKFIFLSISIKKKPQKNVSLEKNAPNPFVSTQSSLPIS